MTSWHMCRFGWQALDSWIQEIDDGCDAIPKGGWDILAIQEIAIKNPLDPIWKDYTECEGHNIVHNKQADFDTVMVISRGYAGKWTRRPHDMCHQRPPPNVGGH